MPVSDSKYSQVDTGSHRSHTSEASAAEPKMAKQLGKKVSLETPGLWGTLKHLQSAAQNLTRL